MTKLTLENGSGDPIIVLDPEATSPVAVVGPIEAANAGDASKKATIAPGALNAFDVAGAADGFRVKLNSATSYAQVLDYQDSENPVELFRVHHELRGFFGVQAADDAVTIRAADNRNLLYAEDALGLMTEGNFVQRPDVATLPELHLFNSYTDADNWERLRVYYGSGYWALRPDALGTGTVRSLVLYAATEVTGTLSCDDSISVTGNMIAYPNGGSSPVLSLNNAYTDGSNYERIAISYDTDHYLIAASAAGTGTVRPIQFNAGAAGALIFGARSKVSSSADGLVTLLNNAGNGFDRLNFGGTTSSFPALKRSLNALQVRLADDSADAPFSCSVLTMSLEKLDTSASAPAWTAISNGTLAKWLDEDNDILWLLMKDSAGNKFSAQIALTPVA